MKTKLLLMLLAIALMAPITQANLLKNPSFEDGAFDPALPPDYWMISYDTGTSNMTWFDDDPNAHSGSRYIKMNTWVAWWSSSAWIWQTVDVTENQEYAFSVWAKCPDIGEASEAWASYEYLDIEDTIISEGWLPLGEDVKEVGIQWTHVEFGTVTAPETATQVIYTLIGMPANGMMGIMFDDACISAPLPSLPSPAWESLVSGDEVELSWTNLPPNPPADSTYVKVLFGTEPNETDPAYNMEPLPLVPASGQDVTSVTINVPDLGTYYWQVKSYLEGDPALVDYDTTDPNDPNSIKGYAWSFDVVADAPLSSVDAGPDMITWSEEPVDLDATVEDDGASGLSYAWTLDPPVGTDISLIGADTKNPIITIEHIESEYAAIVNPSFENGTTGWIGEGGGWIGTWSGFWSNRYYLDPTDGDMVVSLDGLHGDPVEGTWLTQTLTETLTAGRTYNLAVDVINDGAYHEDVKYKVQLLAGGTVIAEDDDTWPLPLGETGGQNSASYWQTSTVPFTVSDPDDPNYAYVGLPLGIRLVCKADTEEMTFDNVRLTGDPMFPPPEFSTVELTLRANDTANPTYMLKDTMTIDVYSDACAAAKAMDLAEDNPGDINADCITDLADLAEMAEKWLNDTGLTEPVATASTGVISYVPITGDADSGISTDNTYTHAVDFGLDTPAALVNGVQFQTGNPDFGPITGTSATIGTGTSSVPNSHGGNDGADPYLDGEAYCAMEDLVEDMTYNDATSVITLTGLTPGRPYKLRLYHRVWGGTRPQDIGFDTDGIGTDITGAEDTAVFFEDDATQPDPSLATATQVYALTYDYVLSPDVTTLTVYINQTGDGTYHLYGLTNEYRGPADPNLPSVNVGDDMITVSGLAVPLAPSIVNNDTAEPQGTLSYLWSAEPVDGVVFSPSAIVEAPTVTITKATLNPSPVVLTLAVTLEGKDPVEDTMTIDLYNDACLAAKAGGTELDPTDFDESCITGLADFAGLAETWLEDYSLTEPVEKP